MRDPKSLIKDLNYIYLDMPFRLDVHRDGTSEYCCSTPMLRQVKETCRDAAAVIENLLLERDSLLELLENGEE